MFSKKNFFCVFDKVRKEFFMRLNTNNTSFSGRYLLQGTPQEVNTAIKTIKSEKGDDVEFLPLTFKKRKAAIVATNQDAVILREKKKDEKFLSSLCKFSSDRLNFFSELFRYIFGTDSNALVLSDSELNRFRFRLTCIDYDNGGLKDKNAITEIYVDGSEKRYSHKGNLMGAKEDDIVYEPISLKNPVPPLEATKEALRRDIERRKIQENYVVENKNINEIDINKDKIKPLFDPVEFAFRDRAYIADYKQGVKVAQDVEGNILGFVFDDGRVKKFDKSGNLQQIIYPNGSVEYFHQDGRRYLTVHDNGEKEYRR